MDKAKELGITNRNKVFCKLIQSGATRKDAMTQAGYSPLGADAGASRMLKSKKIKDYLQYLDSKSIILSDYSREDIRSNLVELAGLSKDDKEYHASIRCNELLGKDVGMFKQELQVSGAVGVVFIGEQELKD